MSLEERPHEWELTPLGSTDDALVICGQITPLTPLKAAEVYGVVDVTRPQMALMDPEDGPLHTEGSIVVWKGRRFSVRLPSETYECIDQADHSLIILDELVEE